MSQPYRLPEGGRIDRDRPLGFTFNGRSLQGYAGDTLASALLANGERVVARSFKYHRPRGIFSAGEEEPSALVELGTGPRRTPWCRATRVPLFEGLTARSQNGWPSVRFDLGRVFDLTHRLWAAGFYNKTFKWPNWRTWEGLIRRMGGPGRPTVDDDPDHYEHVNAHCDLLVCGGGPAGLMAALVAGRCGARVIVAEQDDGFGGCLRGEAAVLAEKPALEWVDEVVDELTALPGVMLLPATTVCGLYDDNVATLLQRGEGTAWRECLWTVRPRRVLLATGAIEQGLIFPGNDRPGTMLAGAARHYLHRHAVAAGRSALVVTNNDSAYQTAFDLDDRGIDVVAVLDRRPGIGDALREELRRRGIEGRTDTVVTGTRGDRGVREVRARAPGHRRASVLKCDLVAVSGGWSPALHLFCHARGRLRFDQRRQCFLPAECPPGLEVTGGAAGIDTLADTLASAQETARRLCDGIGRQAHHAWIPPVDREPRPAGATGPALPVRSRRRQWIDLAHDVTVADAELAVREGFESVEHFKRYTTTGMSVDQGKTGNLNAFLALGDLTGRPVSEVGTTTFRPPYVPMTLGAIAARRQGENYTPRRLLPAHRIHESLGARFEDYGGWQRPEYYRRAEASMDEAVRHEVLTVRRAAGVFDNSPIGKIEVHGPDAAEFLHRVYINDAAGLRVGRSRYGLMLNENGVIIDDGVFSRLAEDHFLVNTTSGGVGRILAGFEELRQCDWPDLDVLFTDVTSQWANFTVAGPRSRELLTELRIGADLSGEKLPHMAIATGHWENHPLRIARISFSGEVSFEVNVPAGHGDRLLDALIDTGARFGLIPYGIEALMTLRLEKGYLHVGSDTDGDTSPDDVGWGTVARAKKTDYIGRRSLFRPANEDPDRRQLVGIAVENAQRAPRAGSHLLIGANRRPPAATDGWITSAAWSPTLERPVAMAMLRGGFRRQGEPVTIIDGDERLAGRVVPTPFVDPDGERLKK